MSVSRRLAHPMLASMFVMEGVDAVQHPAKVAGAAEPFLRRLVDRVPALPRDTETLVRMNGGVQVLAGALLATGRLRRLASAALIGSIVPTTWAGHRFWEAPDDATRVEQRTRFFENLALLGGLLLAAVDTDGAPSLGWRARRRATRIGASAALGRAASEASARRAAVMLEGARGQVAHAGSRAAQLGIERGGRAARAGTKAGRKAARAGAVAGDRAAQAGAKVGARAAEVGRATAERAAPYVTSGAEKASELLAAVREHVPTG